MKIFISVQLYLVLLLSNINAETIPSIHYSDLSKTEINTESLKDSGNKIGAFVVSHMDSSYQMAVEEFYKKAPECLLRHKLPHFKMNDGSVRTTFATLNGDAPLECLSSETEIINENFDAIDNFVAKLIETITGPVDYESEDKIYKYVYKIN